MLSYLEYRQVLDMCQSENDVQTFLEHHSNLLPVNQWLLTHQVHLSTIISKFKLGNEYVTDFAYLTKCSDEWYVVLVEIESPKKKIFNRDDSFTSEFNKAYEQVQSWQRYLSDIQNRQQVLNSLKSIRNIRIMRDNNVTFKYLLVYGRQKERDSSSIRIEKFLQKKVGDIRVCTFDSITTVPVSNPEYMILSPKGNSRYAIKYVPDDFDRNDQGFFAICSSENIEITTENIGKLKCMDYDIDSWLGGKPLSFNYKYAYEHSRF